MPIPLEISPKIITSIASLYNDTNRIFMEYIDNSLDSAEDCFDNITNSYTRQINISLKISGNTYKDGVVIITDNCEGIKDFTSVVKSIGDSHKKEQFTTNGQFGYGIYSFIAACENLKITSKSPKNKAYSIPIKRSQFEASKQSDVKFPDPKIEKLNTEGTIIYLSGFDKEMWRSIDFSEIKTEVEKHFELLLSRKNLKIELIYHNKHEICKPFDYDSLEGEVWQDSISSLTTTKGKKKPLKISFPIEKNPINIFLKITKGKVINKLPVFIIKGRRIAEICNVRSFKTKHRSELWAHSNLTGYINLGGFLSPTIARTDFSNSGNEGIKAKAVFAKLFELEELILEFLREENKNSDDKHYQNLEDFLNKTLSFLARTDNMNFRTQVISGNTINAKNSLEQINKLSNDEEINYVENQGKYFDGAGEYDWSGDKNPQRDIDKNHSKSKNEQEATIHEKSENPFEDDNKIGSEKKKSGFNIKITDRDPDIDSETKEELRSNLIGNTIYIFRNHKNFTERVDKKRSGESKITQRLITYLAGEITIHYKDKLITREGQPSYNKKMFNSVVQFIYKFENMLSELNGKNLSDVFNEPEK